MLPSSSHQSGAKQAIVDKGFNKWKKVLQRFREHEHSDLHRCAVQGILTRGNVPVTGLISSAKANAMKDDRVALLAIFQSLRFLAAQGLPLNVHVVRGRVVGPPGSR